MKEVILVSKSKQQKQKSPELLERKAVIRSEFIVQVDGKQYVLYSGLLQLAHEQGLKSITTDLIQIPQDDNHLTAIVKATVLTKQGSFSDYGDANYTSVGDEKLLPHIIRLASTRAKARALRDAVDISVTAFEELAVGEASNYGKAKFGGAD